MSNVTANYGMLVDSITFLSIFIHYIEIDDYMILYMILMYEVLYFHQNFTDCQYTHFQ